MSVLLYISGVIAVILLVYYFYIVYKGDES